MPKIHFEFRNSHICAFPAKSRNFRVGGRMPVGVLLSIPAAGSARNPASMGFRIFGKWFL